MAEHSLIERFLGRVRSRLNRHRLWTTLIWTTAAAAGAVGVAGLWYVVRGYAVPTPLIAWVAILSVVGGFGAWMFERLNADAAAQAADRQFHLRDAITSYLHFSRAGRNDGYYALQARQTRERVEPLDAQSIKYRPPRRVLFAAVCLLAISVSLGMRGPSQRVLEEQALAEQTADATAEINDQLAKLVDEIAEAARSDERELLDPNKLKQWVKELKTTPEHKEALRQYAQLERKLNEHRLALANRRDQQLLEQAARRMEQTRETQPLAEQLQQKNYDRAAEQLEKMRPDTSDKPAAKGRQELTRLKAAAQHMAAAARAARAEAKQSSASKSSESRSEPSQDQPGEMADAMEELSDAVANLDKALSEDDAKKCESCSKCVGDALGKLSSQLKKLGLCQRCDLRLKSLCNSCSQCQGSLCALCLIPKPGGKKAGIGSDQFRRNERDELVDNGQNTALQGIQGQGPSLTTVEEASEGQGVATRRATAVQQSFQRQFESFVVREGIPDEVKDGVKEYFQVIHQIAPQPTRQESPADAAAPGN